MTLAGNCHHKWYRGPTWFIITLTLYPCGTPGREIDGNYWRLQDSYKQWYSATALRYLGVIKWLVSSIVNSYNGWKQGVVQHVSAWSSYLYQVQI